MVLGINPVGGVYHAYHALYKEEQKGGISGFLASLVPGTGIYKVATGKEKLTSMKGALDVASDVLMFTPLGWVSRGLKAGSVLERAGLKLAAGKGTGELLRTGTRTGAEALGRLLPKSAPAARKAMLYGGLGAAGIGAGAYMATQQAQGQTQSPTYEPEQEQQERQRGILIDDRDKLMWVLAGLAVLIAGYVILRR
ncbi:MAG: hypothetical protein ACXQS4_00650 [Methermicoccaceae archaeon]